MGEAIEFFQHMKEQSVQKRKSNRENSLSLLRSRKVTFEEKNNGVHIIVSFADTKIDFWPGTGLWIDRATGERKRGIFRLLSYIGKD